MSSLHPITRLYALLCGLTAFLTIGNAQVGTGTGAGFPGLPVIISGTVRDPLTASVLSGVTITLTGTSSSTAQTGTDGRFQFNNLPQNGTYTITPTRTGYTFTPPSFTLQNLLGNVDAEISYAIASCSYVLDLIHNFPSAAANRTPILTTGPGCVWSASVVSQLSETFPIVSPSSGNGTTTLSISAPLRSYSVVPRVGAVRAGGAQGTNDEQITRFTQAATDLHAYFNFDDQEFSNDSTFDPNGVQGFTNYISLPKGAFITDGCTTTTFCPNNGVTKEQIAAFLIRAKLRQPGDCLAGSANPTQPPCSQTCRHGYPLRPDNPCGFNYSPLPEFDDVSSNDDPSSPSFNVFYAYIQKLKEMDLAQDCGFRQFCPTSLISRGQMAQFLMQAKFGSQFAYPSTPYFSDVQLGSTFFPYVQKLRQQGITAGVTTSTYIPVGTLVRTQMAVFLVRTFLTLP